MFGDLTQDATNVSGCGHQTNSFEPRDDRENMSPAKNQFTFSQRKRMASHNRKLFRRAIIDVDRPD
jgi:hypothetical protein